MFNKNNPGQPYTHNMVQPGQGGYVQGHQEWTQGIPLQGPQHEQYAAPAKRSWGRATLLFLKDPHALLLLRLLPPALLVWLPFNIMDDAIPVLGLSTDAGWLATAAYVVYRINKYR